MSSPIADGVLAATHKLVQQAMTGQWQEVPRTVEERRVLLDRLSANATPQDQPWLHALKQAMAESDAAVEKMAGGIWNQNPQTGNRESGLGNQDAFGLARVQSPSADCQTDAVASTLDMIRMSR